MGRAIRSLLQLTKISLFATNALIAVPLIVKIIHAKAMIALLVVFFSSAQSSFSPNVE
jgi:hypothetical protein